VNPFALVATSIASGAWLLLSLRPGSLLGFAFTSGDWARALRESEEGIGRDLPAIRSAGLRSLLFHCAVASLCTVAGLASGSSPSPSLSFGAAVIAGLLVAYGILLALTRAPSHRTGA